MSTTMNTPYGKATYADIKVNDGVIIDDNSKVTHWPTQYKVSQYSDSYYEVPTKISFIDNSWLNTRNLGGSSNYNFNVLETPKQIQNFNSQYAFTIFPRVVSGWYRKSGSTYQVVFLVDFPVLTLGTSYSADLQIRLRFYPPSAKWFSSTSNTYKTISALSATIETLKIDERRFFIKLSRSTAFDSSSTTNCPCVVDLQTFWTHPTKTPVTF